MISDSHRRWGNSAHSPQARWLAHRQRTREIKRNLDEADRLCGREPPPGLASEMFPSGGAAQCLAARREGLAAMDRASRDKVYLATSRALEALGMLKGRQG